MCLNKAISIGRGARNKPTNWYRISSKTIHRSNWVTDLFFFLVRIHCGGSSCEILFFPYSSSLWCSLLSQKEWSESGNDSLCLLVLWFQLFQHSRSYIWAILKLSGQLSLVSVPSLGQTDYLVLCEHNESSDQLQNVISSPGISKCAKSQIFIGSPFQQVPALL